jgi:3-methyl-2-oxobutanoate hydroxymethyltransferase
MGSGPGCDGQFIFAEDILGTNSGHYPRHSVTHANLKDDAVKALSQYREDCISGAYPTTKQSIGIKDDEFAKFMAAIAEGEK